MNNSPTLLTHLKPAGEGQIEPLLEMVQGESWRESHLTTPGNARKMYFEFSVRLVERVQRFNPRRPEAQIRGSLINNLKQMEDGRWIWKHDRRRIIRRDSGGEMNEAAWADLAQVRAPTLVVRDAESNMLSPQTAAKMHRVLSDSHLAEALKAGHLVQGDNPVAFERAGRDFLGV